MTTVAQSRRRIGWGIGLAFVGAVLGMALGWIVAAQLEGERDAAQRNAQKQKVTADSALNYMRSACSAGDAVACDYVDKLTALPDAPTPGAAGPAGPVGPVGAAGRDGRDGVNGRNGRDGRDGRPGADGASGTDGLDGTAGESGPTGPAGPQGPPGVDGKDGRDGVDGEDGRGIDRTDCIDGQWVVTYTDGTTQPVSGSSCVVTPGNPGGTP